MGHISAQQGVVLDPATMGLETEDQLADEGEEPGKVPDE